MAIYYYIWSPFSGTLKGQDCYCNNCANGNPCTDSGGFCTVCGSSQCNHPAAINGLCCPVDIFGGANTTVVLRTSSGIQSIRTTRTGPLPNNDGDLLCASTPPSGFAWVNEGVRVRLYTGTNGGGSLVGTVFYGHLKSRIANGTYNSPNLRTMGYLGDQNCNCSCYTGIHVHMARSSGNSGYTYHRYCNYPLVTSSSVYRWFL